MCSEFEGLRVGAGKEGRTGQDGQMDREVHCPCWPIQDTREHTTLDHLSPKVGAILLLHACDPPAELDPAISRGRWAKCPTYTRWGVNGSKWSAQPEGHYEVSPAPRFWGQSVSVQRAARESRRKRIVKCCCCVLRVACYPLVLLMGRGV